VRTHHLAGRLDGLGTTVFAEMSALAVETGAVNLGQGFPDTDGPTEIAEAAIAASAISLGPSVSGKPCPRLTAPVSTASADISAKTVVPRPSSRPARWGVRTDPLWHELALPKSAVAWLAAKHRLIILLGAS